MNSESIDCIATDPPFNSKRAYFAPLGSRSAGQKFDDVWRWDEVTDEWQDVIAAGYPKIKELIEAAAVIEGGSINHRTGKISTGRTKNSIAAYLAWMAPRIVEMRRVLKPSGVLFMQCDTEANSYLRLLLDAIFGRGKFINEIVRRRAKDKNDTTRKLGCNHDTILAYGKTLKWKWHPSFEPYDMANLDPKTLAQYEPEEGTGRLVHYGDLTSPQKNRPNLTYEFLGVTRVWRRSRKRMEEDYKAGTVVQLKPGRVPRSRRYLDEQKGKMRDDIWLDLVQPDSSDSEWGTRKPVPLYQRLVECATDKGDIVLDPFCGCATTLIAAENLERQWVGIDIDPVAETETERRLFNECGLTSESPVRIRKSLRRSDIPHIPNDKLRDKLWNSQGRKCANPYCDSEAVRKVDIELDHRIPKSRGGKTMCSTVLGYAQTATGAKEARRGDCF